MNSESELNFRLHDLAIRASWLTSTTWGSQSYSRSYVIFWMTPRTCDNARETEDPKAHRCAENAGRHKHWHVKAEPQSGWSVEFRVPPERLASENEKAFAQRRRGSREGHQRRPLLLCPYGRLDCPNVTTRSGSKRPASTDTDDDLHVEKHPTKKPKSQRRREWTLDSQFWRMRQTLGMIPFVAVLHYHALMLLVYGWKKCRPLE
jgi:hypothetical protein